jgi:hypothetical protein
MKNVLDLLEEFCWLNDERIHRNGLSPDMERRWDDLRALFEKFMIPLPSDKERSALARLQGRLIRRARLRVPTDMHIFFRHEDDTFPSRVINIGRGGLFLFSRALLERGRKVVVYLPNLDCALGELFETEGRVAWNTGPHKESKVLHGMGIRFNGIKDLASEQLDSFLIEQLDTRLYKSGQPLEQRLAIERLSTR